MFCINCGREAGENQKFCTNCGASFSSNTSDPAGYKIIGIEKEKSADRMSYFIRSKKFFNLGWIIRILIVVAVIGFIVYNSFDDDSIQKNSEGLNSFNSGDTQRAIQQIQEATNTAVKDDTKISTLKNLGYIYSSDGKNDLARGVFKEALALAEEGSFDYYLIAGEIALLDSKPNAAQLSYNKAYEIDPNDFQINNALNLFYLNLDETSSQYINYPGALEHAKKAYSASGPEAKNIAKQNLAIAHYFNENYDQTISLLSSEDFNKEPFAAYWVGLSYAGKKDHVSAKAYFRKAIDGGAELPQEIYDYLNLK